VSFAHDPIQSLAWPAMTISFGVKDTATLDKLAVGKKADVEFVKRGAGYVITKVK
jgi:Cu(I)/Ag(I) efflux system protein CusF